LEGAPSTPLGRREVANLLAADPGPEAAGEPRRLDGGYTVVMNEHWIGRMARCPYHPATTVVPANGRSHVKGIPVLMLILRRLAMAGLFLGSITKGAAQDDLHPEMLATFSPGRLDSTRFSVPTASSATQLVCGVAFCNGGERGDARMESACGWSAVGPEAREADRVVQADRGLSARR